MLLLRTSDLTVDKAQEVLEIVDPIERLKKLSEIIGKEIELLNMQAKILSQAKEEMSKSQREYFLREQMKAIRTELGEGDERSEEVEDLRKTDQEGQDAERHGERGQEAA